MSRDGHFLSAENPLATVDQRDLENTALRLLGRPELQKARTMVSHLWRQAVAYPEQDQMSRFDAMIDEYMFHFTLRAVNSDANYPKVLRYMAPPHHWFGRDVPGSRWAGDSPDFIYRIIPVSHGARYELHVKPTCANPPVAYYALMADTPAPIVQSLLESPDLPAGNGEQVITIDATPAEGRKNHLQTRPGSDHLMLRDALGDWVAQKPNALRIRRLDAPDRAPLSDDEFAERAARIALAGVYYAYYCTRSAYGQAPNQLRPLGNSAAYGGMPTQVGVKCTLDLAEDEAMILTAAAAGALFRNIVIQDAFFVSVNYWSRLGNLNNTQMAPDEDGRFTYVVAHKDPGVHNWLDTEGLRKTIIVTRWQGVPADSKERPSLKESLVKFKDLDTALPRGVRRIDAAGRRNQIAQRQAGFKQRFIDS